MRDLINERDLSSKNSKDYQHEILRGLEKPCKQINYKYLYDEKGSLLFDSITKHPDYYLTKCELEILKTNVKKILAFLELKSFNLIELGPGEGIKSKLFLDAALKQSMDFTYIPVDISKNALQLISQQLQKQYQQLKSIPLHAEYLPGLRLLKTKSNQRNMVLFLGSSIGNFEPIKVKEFLHELRTILNHDDFVLIGFDLRKDINLLMRAYNDSAGITREFNLNVLHRINKELKADFDLSKFSHYATYNVYSRAMESYLISLEKQIVSINAFNTAISFHAYEPIHVEYSYKYLLTEINHFALETGFEIRQNFLDSKQYFVDSLWQVKKF